MPTANQARVIVRSDERLALVGKTGSGKTFMARFLTNKLRRLVVLDPKGTIDPVIWRLQWWDKETQNDLHQGKEVRLLVRAPLDGNWSPYLEAVYLAGNVVLYIDETDGIQSAPGAKPNKWLTASYTRGRERGIGVWAATQRPAWIPRFVLSEAEWVAMFRLQLDDDRKIMASIINKEVEQPITDKHGFWIYNTEWDRPIYTRRLQIQKVA